MAKFKVGDKVRVIDDEKLLEEENLTNKELAPLLGLEFDPIKPDMVGIVKAFGLVGNQYLIDFGKGFKGIDNKTDDYKGTNVFVTKELLELVEVSEPESTTHNEVEEVDDEIVLTMKLKGMTLNVEITEDGKTISRSSVLDIDRYLKFKLMIASLTIIDKLGDLDD